MAKIVFLLSEFALAVVFVVWAGKATNEMAHQALASLKKKTFSTMQVLMSESFEGYTVKLTGRKSEFALTDSKVTKRLAK